MAIELKKDTITQLKKSLIEWLKEAYIRGNHVPSEDSRESLSKLDDALPKSGERREVLNEIINETPFSSFIAHSLIRDLSEKYDYNSSAVERKLIEYEEYKDYEGIAQKYVDAFISLPNEYVLTLACPKELSDVYVKQLQNNIDISESIKFVVPDDNFSNNYPLFSGIDARDKKIRSTGNPFADLIRTSKQLEWKKDLVYLQIYFKGFVGYYSETRSHEIVLNEIKSFLGVCFALKLFKTKVIFDNVNYKASYFVHLMQNGKWNILDKKDVEQRHARIINNLVLGDIFSGAEDKKALLLYTFLLLHNVYRERKNSEKLIRACQWYFESFCSTDELFSFLQIMMVMETILGDKDEAEKTGLTELLSNRCAYLISDSIKERDSIIKEFKQIYNIRSIIIHSGRNVFTQREKYLHKKLQWYCRRVILKEIELISKK